MPSSERRILNSRQGVTNVIRGKSLAEMTIATLDEIIDILKDHCGMHAANALLIFDDGQGRNNANVFTKDGIDILNNIEFISPIQEYVKAMISYIGQRIDAAAHDGTTTSMYLAASLLKKYLTDIFQDDESYDILDHGISTVLLTESLNRIMEMIKERAITLDDYAEMFDSREEARGHLAYLQTLVSSKGNKILANCMREIFTVTPVDMIETFTYAQEGIETEDEYRVQTPEWDFEFKALANTRKHFNANLGTDFEYDSVDVIVYVNEFAHGYRDAGMLETYLEETDRPTVIIYRGNCTNQMVQMCDAAKFAIPFAYTNRYVGAGQMAPEMMAILAAAGKVPLGQANTIEDTIIRDVRISFSVSTLKMDRVIKYDEGSKIHPYYTNPGTNEAYDQFVQELKMLIKKYKNNHESDTVHLLDEANRIFRATVAGKLPRLVIGGKTYDHHANLSVARDVLGAITATFQQGFVVDGNLMLYKLANGLPQLQESMMELLCVIHRLKIEDIDFLVRTYVDDVDTYDAYFNTLDRENPQLRRLGDKDVNPIIQPVCLYTELIKRMLEVLPKFISTTNVIVPGTAFVENSE